MTTITSTSDANAPIPRATQLIIENGVCSTRPRASSVLVRARAFRGRELLVGNRVLEGTHHEGLLTLSRGHGNGF